MIFFSRSDNFIGNAIVFFCTWGEKPDPNLPNHAGFIWSTFDEKEVAEVGPKGFRRDTLEKYQTATNRIVRVFEPIYDGEFTQERLLKTIARALRKDQDEPYDYVGAAGSSNWLRRWFPWLTGRKDAAYCSEKVGELLCEAGRETPTNLNPLALAQWDGFHNWLYREVTVS